MCITAQRSLRSLASLSVCAHARLCVCVHVGMEWRDLPWPRVKTEWAASVWCGLTVGVGHFLLPSKVRWSKPNKTLAEGGVCWNSAGLFMPKIIMIKKKCPWLNIWVANWNKKVRKQYIIAAVTLLEWRESPWCVETVISQISPHLPLFLKG